MAKEQQGDQALEIDQDLDFQRRSWKVQRLGWVGLGLIVLAALLGLCGPGPLSNASASSQDGSLVLKYNRFWRLQSLMTLRVALGPMVAHGGEARVWLSRSYLDSVRVQHVTPPPQRVEAGADRLTYVFSMPQADQPMGVTFHIEPERPGPMAGRLGLDGGAWLSFAQFIYP